MKLVAQKHTMGCGIACVASAAGVSYDEALSKTNVGLAGTRGYYLREIKEALKRLGLHYEHRKYGDKYKHLLENEGTIVFIKRSKDEPAGHYLLRTKNGWMDSWINYPSISPAEAGFQGELTGEPQWVLFPKDN